MNDAEISREMQQALDALVALGKIVLSDDGTYWPAPQDMHEMAADVRPLTVELPGESTVEDAIAKAATA